MLGGQSHIDKTKKIGTELKIVLYIQLRVHTVTKLSKSIGNLRILPFQIYTLSETNMENSEKKNENK